MLLRPCGCRKECQQTFKHPSFGRYRVKPHRADMQLLAAVSADVESGHREVALVRRLQNESECILMRIVPRTDEIETLDLWPGDGMTDPGAVDKKLDGRRHADIHRIDGFMACHSITLINLDCD